VKAGQVPAQSEPKDADPIPAGEYSGSGGFQRKRLLPAAELLQYSVNLLLLLRTDFIKKSKRQMKIAAMLPPAFDGIFPEPLLQVEDVLSALRIKINSDKGSDNDHLSNNKINNLFTIFSQIHYILWVNYYYTE
jgi:hypothetical protein